MIEALIINLCLKCTQPKICEKDLKQCIERENKIKYEDSQWHDVPDEKMSLESLNTCTGNDEAGYLITL